MKIFQVIFLVLSLVSCFSQEASIGTPLSKNATKVVLLGSGELGKELVIELQRFGVEVIAVDRYENAPAMQVAHSSYVINMRDGNAIKEIVEKEKPNLIVPEIEAIATDMLLQLEDEGWTVIPTARAVHTTMNRERIRKLAAEDLKLKTSQYLFASSKEEYLEAVEKIGLPCVVKPTVSSSGKGQTIVKTTEEIEKAWNYAQENGRAKSGKVIIEEFVPFDYEITMLTVRHAGGTTFCAPIGHIQIDGDYRYSWQPHSMTEKLYQESCYIAKTITDALGGKGIFGVELFIKGDEVYFNEVSPRPHDTGLVTLISQDFSEFALHARAILDLPIPCIKLLAPSASCALLAYGTSSDIQYNNISRALSIPGTQLRLFGKPEVVGHRRMGVTLATADTIEEARKKAVEVRDAIQIDLK